MSWGGLGFIYLYIYLNIYLFMHLFIYLYLSHFESSIVHRPRSEEALLWDDGEEIRNKRERYKQTNNRRSTHRYTNARTHETSVWNPYDASGSRRIRSRCAKATRSTTACPSCRRGDGMLSASVKTHTCWHCPPRPEALTVEFNPFGPRRVTHVGVLACTKGGGGGVEILSFPPPPPSFA